MSERIGRQVFNELPTQMSNVAPKITIVDNLLTLSEQQFRKAEILVLPIILFQRIVTWYLEMLIGH